MEDRIDYLYKKFQDLEARDKPGTMTEMLRHSLISTDESRHDEHSAYHTMDQDGMYLYFVFIHSLIVNRVNQEILAMAAIER